MTASTTDWIHPEVRRGLALAARLPGHRLVQHRTEHGIGVLRTWLVDRTHTAPADHRGQALLDEACHQLGLSQRPQLRLMYDPLVGAMALAGERPIIAVTRRMERVLDATDGWGCLFGHEVGHLVAGHARARVHMAMLAGMGGLAGVLDQIMPVGIGRRLKTHLRTWMRHAELSADRAGAVVGGLDASLRLMSAVEAAVERAAAEGSEQHNPYGEAFDTHPPWSVRAAALRRWSADGGMVAAREMAEWSRVWEHEPDVDLDAVAAAELAEFDDED